MTVAQSTPWFENIFEGGPAQVEVSDKDTVFLNTRGGVWTFAPDLTPLQYHVPDSDIGQLHFFTHQNGQVTRSTRLDYMWHEYKDVTVENDYMYKRFSLAVQALNAIARQVALPPYILENMPRAYAFFGLTLAAE